jgi:hypothetical protein
LKATSDEIKQKNKGMLLQYAKKDWSSTRKNAKFRNNLQKHKSSKF